MPSYRPSQSTARPRAHTAPNGRNGCRGHAAAAGDRLRPRLIVDCAHTDDRRVPSMPATATLTQPTRCGRYPVRWRQRAPQRPRPPLTRLNLRRARPPRRLRCWRRRLGGEQVGSDAPQKRGPQRILTPSTRPDGSQTNVDYEPFGRQGIWCCRQSDGKVWPVGRVVA